MKKSFLCGLALFLVALVLPAVDLVAETVYTDVSSRCVKCHAEKGLMGPAP